MSVPNANNMESQQNSSTQEAQQPQGAAQSTEPTIEVTGRRRSPGERTAETEQRQEQPAQQNAAQSTEQPSAQQQQPAQQTEQPRTAKTLNEVAAEASAPAPSTPQPDAPVEPSAAVDPFKAIGLEKNDFTEKALAAIKAGDFSKFAQVHSVNADTLDDNAALRWQIEQENPTLSPAAQQRMLDKRLAEQFYEGSENDDDKSFGAELKKVEADKARAALKASQASYTPPVPDTAAQEQAARQAAAKLITDLQTDPAIKAFETNRRIVVGEGEDAYNYEAPASVDPVRLIADGEAFNRLFTDEKGTPDRNKMIRMLTYSADPDAFERALVEHGRALGERKAFNELRNPRQETSGQPTSVPEVEFTGRTRRSGAMV